LFYLPILTDVQRGSLVSRGRCQICKRFRPNSYESCPHLWSQPLCYPCPQFFQTCRKNGTVLCL